MSVSSLPCMWQALDVYRLANLTTRLHAWIRVLLCPFQRILPYLPESGVHLDVGCGYGMLLAIMHYRSPWQPLVGIDVDKYKVVQASRLDLASVRFQVLSAREVEDASYDSISVIDVLYLLPIHERAELLRECWRILRPDGHLVVKEASTVPRWKGRICTLEEILAVRLLGITKGQTIQFLSDRRMAELIADAGFMWPEVKRIDAGYPHPHVLFVTRKSA